MKVVIFGAGRRGLRLARHLIEEKREVVFLDSSEERCEAAEQKLDCLTVVGSAMNIADLERAGCRDAYAVVALTESDEINLVSCGLVASAFPQVKETIAAIRSVSYSGLENTQGRLLGITHIVNPEEEASSRIAGILSTGVFRDFAAFEGTDFYMFSRIIKKDSPFINKSLMDIKKETEGRYIFIGLKRRGKVSTPSGPTVIKEGDEVTIVVDNDESIGLFNKISEKAKYKMKKIVIVGASRIAFYTLKKLDKDVRKAVTLIERDHALCQEFATEFPDILVVNGAITDEDLWESERLSSADVVVALTENDETNIIVASYAKKLSASHAVSLVSKNISYVHLAEAMDIDSAIYTADATVDAITKSLRGEGVKSLHTTFDGELEVFEYTVPPSFLYLGKKLKDIDFKGRLLVCGVKKEGEGNFVPDGNYSFEERDSILIASAHSNWAYIQELFK